MRNQAGSADDEWINLETSKFSLGSLSNHNDDGNNNVPNLHIWQWKAAVLHALHVHFSFFEIPQTFSFFPRREMTCFASVDEDSRW